MTSRKVVTHLDLRVADSALAWRGRDDEVLRGYEDESPLEPIERALIVPVYWAWMIACAVADIDSGRSPEWALTHLVRPGPDLPSVCVAIESVARVGLCLHAEYRILIAQIFRSLR